MSLCHFPVRLLLAITLLASAGAQQPAIDRALPLNHSSASHLTQTDSQGFYFMPIAVGDD